MTQSTIFSKNEITSPSGENTFYATTTNNALSASDGRMRLSTIKNYINTFDDTDFPFTASDFQTAIEILGSPEYSVIKGTAPYILIKETDNSSDDYKIQSVNGDLDIFRTNDSNSYSPLMKFFVSNNSLKFFQSDIGIQNSIPKLSFVVSDVLKSQIRFETDTLIIQNIIGNEFRITKDVSKTNKPFDFNSSMVVSEWINNNNSIEDSTNVSGIWHDTINKEWNFQSNIAYKTAGNSGIKCKNLKLSSNIELTSLLPSLNNKTWDLKLSDDGSLSLKILSDDKVNSSDFLNFTRDGINPVTLLINSDIHNPSGKLFFSKKTGNNYNGFWSHDSGVIHFISNALRNASGNAVLACSNLSFDGGNNLLFTSGTWEPEISGSITTGSATYATRIASYKKVNKTVFTQMEIEVSDFTGTGDIVISNLPFQPINGEGFLSVIKHSGFVIPIGSSITGDCRENLSQISLNLQSNVEYTKMTHSELGSTFYLLASFVYHI